jgi:hypothetical protein
VPKVQLRRWMIPVVPGTFSQWHCDCGKTINNNVLVGKLVGLLVGKPYHKILKDGVSLPTSSEIA